MLLSCLLAFGGHSRPGPTTCVPSSPSHRDAAVRSLACVHIPMRLCMHGQPLELLGASSRTVGLRGTRMHAESHPNEQIPSAAGMHERAIALSGLSKTYGCPGLRVGWLATRSRAALAAVAAAKDYTTICHPAPAEVLALAALRDGGALAAANREMIAANAAAARAAFARLSSAVEWHDPQGGSIAFPRCAPATRLCCVCCAIACREVRTPRSPDSAHRCCCCCCCM